MKYLISFCLLFRVFISPAQENNPLLNSGEIIAKGVSLNDENKFKEAIELYKKVNRGDTNYFKALYEIAYSQYADSQFVACLQNCEKGLSEPNDHWPYLYSMYGNLLDDLGKPERALAIYDSAIALYPSFSELYLNKGTTLIRLKKFAEAEAVLKQNILINPYMSSAHFKLGLAALNQGKIVESFLCFVNYLLLAPQGRFQQNCISMLNAITNSTDEVREFQQKRSTEPIEDFALAERIVLSKIALDKNYKPLIKLDDPISRQIQVLFEKISYNENEPDFWMQCYVPHFKHFFSSGQFEAFTNRLFSGLNVEVVQDYVKKHKKELAAIVDEASAYYEKLRSTRELNFNAREKKSDWYHFDEGGLYGRGYFNSAGDVPVGDWEYYYTPGNIRTKGKFDEKGEKDGEWTYYHFNGLVRGKQRFNHGTQDGKEVFYFDNGLISSEGQFQNGLQTGQANVYFRTGQLNSTAHTIDGKLDGERVIYYNNGNKQALENYKADSLDGQSMNWYNTGPLQSKSLFSNGSRAGKYEEYFSNGKLNYEGSYQDGKAQGPWKLYFQNGKLKSITNYAGGVEDGEYQEYFDNGVLSTKSIVKDGKLSGEVEYFGPDGKRFCVFEFDNNMIKAARYYDKTGKEISRSEKKSKVLNLANYTHDGYKYSQAQYNDKGELNGKQTYYYKTGAVSSEYIYKDGLLDGPSVDYYPNGNKQATVEYKEGVKHGYQKNWYNNGHLQEEGWYQDGNLQGCWKTYNELGDLTIQSYYLDDELRGYKEEYHPNGKLDCETKYEEGTIALFIQYDSTGKEFKRCILKNGTGAFTIYHGNNNLYIKGTYKNGFLDGSYQYYYFDGKLNVEQYYKRGYLDSAYKNYYHDGTVALSGNYLDGEKTGEWKNYLPNGHVSSIEQYADGELHGKQVYYYVEGKIESEVEMKNGSKQGLSKKWDLDGSLLYQMMYEDDFPISYTYMDKTGKLLPDIFLPAGTGKLTSYFQNGNPSAEVEYHGGKINGNAFYNYSNGKPRKQSRETEGLTEGGFKSYHPNGKLHLDYYYTHDNLHGFYKEYNDKGILTEEGYYYNGFPHDITKIYDDNGKLKETRYFYYGELMNIK